MISGGTPATAKARKNARGLAPRALALSAEVRMSAAAPSLSGDEFPAVTVPVGSKAGLSAASFSSEVSARGPSSRSTVMSRQTSPSKRRVLTGRTSAAKSPRVQAATALPWLASAKASCCSRVTPNLRATFSAVFPIGMCASGNWSTTAGLSAILAPPIGMSDIVSRPPASPASIDPAAIRSATMAAACNPDEQKRLTVIAGTLSGSPARKPTWRATFSPCSASGWAQPRTTSSTSAGAMAARFIASRATSAQRSSERVFLKTPRGARPMGVRTAERMVTSRMGFFLWPRLLRDWSVPQRFALGQHVLDALAGLGFPAQREERLALEVEDVLLADRRASRDGPAREDARQVAAHLGVVLADLVRALEVVQRAPQRGGAGLADDPDHPRRRRPVAGAGDPQRQRLGVGEQRLAGEGDRVALPEITEIARLLGAGRDARGRQVEERHADQRQQIELRIVGGAGRGAGSHLHAAAAGRDEAHADLDTADVELGRRPYRLAPHHHLGAAAQREAERRADHRHAGILGARTGVLEADHHLLDRLVVALAERHHEGEEVGARAEG